MLACDNSNSSVSAPGSLVDKTYKMTISSGSGLFETTGTYTVSFLNSQDLYVIFGDSDKISDSAGTYNYTATGNRV